MVIVDSHRRFLMARSFFRVSVLLISLVLSFGLWASDAYWIDVRSAEEYQSGHVNEAVNIPYEEIGARIDEVTEDKEAVIYLYCRSGRRSGIALETLQRAGYTNVINLGTREAAQAFASEPQAQE
jgi:phage shock protein E